MRKTIPILILIFSVFATTTLYAFETVRVLYHVHTACSDGEMSFIASKGYALRHWYRAIIITDHGDMVENNRKDDWEWCKPSDYPREMEWMNEENFIALYGYEVTVDPIESLYHLNKISDVSDPYIYELGRFTHDRIDDFITEVCEKEDAICCANHPRTAPEWADKIGEVFECIELMNDVDINPTEKKVSSNNQLQLSYYLDALKRGQYVYVMGGADLHNRLQTIVTGEIATEVFSDEFSRESLISAIKEGRTIATKNAWIEYISDYPSRIVKQVGDSDIKIEIRYIVKDDGAGPTFRIFENGEEAISGYYQTSLLASKDGYSTYSAYFKVDRELPAQPTCFVIDIDGFLTSSPYCYQTEE